MAKGNDQQNAMALNAQARAILLNTGVPMKKRIARKGPYSLGDLAQIQLDRVGIMTALEVTVTADVTVATNPAVRSAFGAYPLVNKITYTDFNSVDRVQSSGVQLFALNSLRAGWPYDQPLRYNGTTSDTFPSAPDADQYQHPNAVGANQIIFNLMVPLAYNPKADLRGAVLAQTVVGDHYLKLQFANASKGDAYNAPYATSADAVTINNIYVDVWEWYIQPQNLMAIPQIDLSTIYGVEGNYLSTDNFSAGAAKYINWPNNRSILSAQHIVMNNALPAANTIFGAINLIANSNTFLREESAASLRRSVRMILGSDLPPGEFVFDTRSNPIATTLYGNVQSAVNIASGAALTNPYVVSQFEDFYPSGVPLPGVATGAY